VALVVPPPVSPMLAKASRALPDGDGWSFEPKFDGFRCIVFRDGDEVELGSRNERPLTRYFPEIAEPLLASLPERAVVDGELVVVTDHGLDFDRLSLRIHPAASRVALLAEQIPVTFVGFDLLAEGDDDLRPWPFAERRARLERALRPASPSVRLCPVTADRALAAVWFDHFEGAGLDGVIAKPLAEPYREGERAMLKVKHQRTADCVVAGSREHKQGGVGSLLLGLHDRSGRLHHVGVASSFAAPLRARLAADLAPYRDRALDDHPWADWAEWSAPDAVAPGRMPGGQSRWSAGKDLSWDPVRPELVVEVAYEHVQRVGGSASVEGGRFRHTARFVRWRPDRNPGSCDYAQLDAPVPAELHDLFTP
jgi:ATP-dependent DNA ligase